MAVKNTLAYYITTTIMAVKIGSASPSFWLNMQILHQFRNACQGTNTLAFWPSDKKIERIALSDCSNICRLG